MERGPGILSILEIDVDCRCCYKELDEFNSGGIDGAGCEMENGATVLVAGVDIEG